jgi:hypothetical protein
MTAEDKTAPAIFTPRQLRLAHLRRRDPGRAVYAYSPAAG